MKWLIESNVAKEESYDDFISALDSMGVDYNQVTVVPFSHEVIGVPDTDKPIFVFGSVRLCNKIAPEMGWKSFTNENFDYNVWCKHWGSYLLNTDVSIGPFQSVVINMEEFFIRPCKDNKAFTGKVTTLEEYHDWVDKVIIVKASDYGSSEDVDFDLDEEVMVSPVQRIVKEIRFYVVAGKIVTHSTYRWGNKTKYFDETYTDEAAIELVEEAIGIWQPDDAFVIDVALVASGFKIIEVNCINCSGLYKANAVNLAGSLNELLEDMS